MQGTHVDYIKFLAALLIFGTNGLLVTHIHLASTQIVFTRTLLGGVFLLLVALVSRQLELGNCRRQLGVLLTAGFCLGANWVFLFEAYRYASVSLGTLIYYCGPVLVMVLSPFLFQERLTWNKLIAVGAVILGMVCITGISGGLSFRGLMNGALAALLYALLIIANKNIRQVSGLNSTLVQLVVAFFIISLYLFLRGQLPFAIPEGRELIYVLVLGLVNTGVACYLYFASMQRLPGQTVALLCYVDPLSAVLFAALFLGEQLTGIQILGAIFILGGALLGELSLTQLRKFKEYVCH
jgi:drug/metabolite transporter (DMT)-like permease